MRQKGTAIRWLPVLAVIAAFATVTLAGPSTSRACSPAPKYQVDYTQDDVPECVDLPRHGAMHPILMVDNRCDQPLMLEKRECPSCQQDATIEPGEDAELSVAAEDEMDVDETRTATYTWMLGDDREGVIEADVTRAYGSSDGCDTGSFQKPSDGCGCTSGSGADAGDLPGSAWIVALLLTAGGLLRRLSDE